MNYEKNGRSKCPFVLLVLACATMISVGCQGTVRPRVVHSSVASWDVGGLNSGLIGWTNVDDADVAIITQHARDRYNGLIGIYGTTGTNFIPHLNIDRGICTNCIPGLILMDERACADFSKMQRWWKSPGP